MLNKQEFKKLRKEDKGMTTVYTRAFSLEAETTQDILTAHLREAVRVLSLVVKDVEFKVEGYFEAFTLSVKFDDYLNQTRYVQFKVTKNQRAWNITYRIYSYSDFLRERTIETNSTLELQMFIRTVLKEDLVLELDSNMVE